MHSAIGEEGGAGAARDASTDHARNLLAIQRAAFRQQMNPALDVRLDRLDRLERLLDPDTAHALSDCISADFGTRSPVETRLAESIFVRAGIRHARRHLRDWMRTRRMPTAPTQWPGRSLLMRQPLGVVGIISPWNYPLQLALAPLVGALAAGNRALVKPSELTPLFSQALRAHVSRLFDETEVAVVTGDAETGKAFAALPFDHLVFTGSTAVGRQVAQAAAANLTPVTLELGGKSPAIIDTSADLAITCERLAFGKLLNAGQTCIAPDYVLAPRAELDAVVEALRSSISRLYPSIAANADYTSIINARHHARLRSLIDEAVGQGARAIELRPPGETVDPSARKIAPTLLLDCHDGMRVMQEEIFGPVLPILPYDRFDDAIDYVNARPRPLALYWFGSDRARREQVLASTLSGGVTINDTLLHIAQESLPFGGVGASGSGQYHGEFGFRQFSKEKPIFVQSRFSGVLWLYPPYGALTDRLLRVLSRLS